MKWPSHSITSVNSIHLAMRSVPSTNSGMLRRSVLALIISFIPFLLFSQPNERQLKKFSPVLQKNWREKPREKVARFIIAVKDFSSFKNKIGNNAHIRIAYEYKEANVLLIRATWNELVQTILPEDEVLFVDEQRTPKEELAVSNLDL